MLLDGIDAGDPTYSRLVELHCAGALLGLYAVNNLYSGFERLATMDWAMVSLTIVLAIFATILAGLYPTWRACHVAPAAQLKTQ